MENIKLFTLVSQINELPPFPEVAYRIINIIDKEDTTAKVLTEIILQEPSLTLKIINVANSAYYSPRTKIKNVTHAVQYLGFNTIKSIAYSSAVQAIKSDDKNNFLVSRFQEKAIVSAYVSRMLINKINFYRNSTIQPEDFYIYSLFHDIGEIVVSVIYPDIMKEIIDKILDGADIKEVEGKLKHSQIGLMLMRKWNLPESYASTCSKHHILDPEKIDDEQLFINDILMIADSVTAELGYDPTYNSNIEIEKSIFRIGLRESDIYNDDGIIGEVKKSIESQLSFLS